MGDGVSATDRVELVEQRANVELGRVDGNAELEAPSARSVQNLQFALRQWHVAISW